MKRLTRLARKSTDVIRNEGAVEFTKKAVKYVYYRQLPNEKKRPFKDILFINGCALPHPARYRVDHQIEQLASAGITADSIFYDQLDLSILKQYQGFVFFRCPVTDTVKEFINQAKFFNKTCFFDIDDLVIDQKYTDKNKYVSSMSVPDKALYDDGVNRMRETLNLCEYAITTTERLQKELKNYKNEVFVNRNVASDELVRLSIDAAQNTRKDSSKVVLGYFSGSITHNEDFELITPALIEILKKYPHVYLKIAGILDIPNELEPFRGQIIATGFTDWRSLPKTLATCDMNLAPLTDSIFNEAKSENKWTEAALVNVPTIASDFGAFKTVIIDGKSGVLVKKPSDWFIELETLINNKETREQIGKTAQRIALEEHTTVSNAQQLAGFIRSKLRPSIAFVLPTSDISGGVTVAVKHAEILRNNNWNVTLIDDIHKRTLKKSVKKYNYRLDLAGFNMVTSSMFEIDAFFDTVVATLWTTVKFVKEYPNVKNRLYLVQGFETEFAPWGAGEGKFKANATYLDATNIRYITISMWCKGWLKEKFNKDAKYAPNGINSDLYTYKKRDFSNRKIKILIEGDSKNELKNTDEAFRIVDTLDKNKYHISYLSYHKEPKPWYRVDKFYNRIPPEKVGEIYTNTDILIKTSLRESFSYPPLEMMATGGFAVVIPNDGNKEYLVHKKNCLLYEAGDIEAGKQAVELIASDAKLRTQLAKNGVETAERYDWKGLEQKILALYE